ncbi:MAG TPA: sugar phosphate isomerase/epimerase [Cyclobacteriaceae bacterium]
MHISRKDFLRALGLAGTGLLLNTTARSATGGSWPGAGQSFTLGLASYTFRNFSLEDTIKAASRLGLKKLALKSMHLPLDSTPAQIREAVARIREAGLELYGAGVIYMKTEAEVNQAFDYAKNAGMEVIIGVPNHELLHLADKKVKEYNIKLAIHNHGPGDQLYSSVKDVYERIKDLDKRIGLCMDIGHVVRIQEDPAALAIKYKDRLYDCHLKDEDKREADGKPIEAGRGVIDLPAFLKAVTETGYAGTLSFEYEKDGDDPLPGLAESVGYVKGILTML